MEYCLYYRCDDPEVDNFGSKWSFSALLRHLKIKGIDTKGKITVFESSFPIYLIQFYFTVSLYAIFIFLHLRIANCGIYQFYSHIKIVMYLFI